MVHGIARLTRIFSLITSVLVANIYAFLIRFLRRPDLSQLYLSPQSSTDSFPAPWERMTFPNFDGLRREDHHTQSDDELSLAEPPSPASPKLEVTTLTPPGAAYIPEHRYSASSDMTLVPARPILKHNISHSIIASPPLALLSDCTLTSKLTLTRMRRAKSSPFKGCWNVDHRTGEDEEDDRRTKTPSIRAATPDGSGRMVSMASFMNRRTLLFLLWFPLTVSTKR